MSEQRIVELEIKMAYQEEMMESLSSTIASQQKQISKLEETCMLLHDKIKALSNPDGNVDPRFEIPPHY